MTEEDKKQFETYSNKEINIEIRLLLGQILEKLYAIEHNLDFY